jgi:hypothetical protein
MIFFQRLARIGTFTQEWVLDPNEQTIQAGQAMRWTKNVAVDGATALGVVGVWAYGTPGNALIDHYINQNNVTCYFSNPRSTASSVIYGIHIFVLYTKN